MKYLGLDYGTKKIGVAHSDEAGKVAFPLVALEAGPKALARIEQIVKEQAVEKIVLGESRNFAGVPNPVQKNIEQFKKDLEELTGLPVAYEPEFMTSVQASRAGQDKRGEIRGPKELDAAAAALILQGYLDKMSNHGGN